MAQLSNRDFSRINGYVLSPKMKNKKTQSERQNIEPKSEPEDEVPITPIEEDHNMAQGKGTRTHDKLTEGMDSLPLAKKKRKKKNRLYDSVLENGLVLPSESNGDIDATLGNLNVPSKKKKHRRAEDSLQNSSCCVGEASPTNQSDPVNPKKKKHCTNDEQNEEEPLFAEHLSEEEEPLSSKKKSKKKHHVHDARHNAEGDKSLDHSDADLQNLSKKKKKTKHYISDDQSHGEEMSFTEQLVVSNALNSKKKKKKKKHPPENDQDQEEDAGFTEHPDVEDPLFTKKKRKKEKHKPAEDQSQWEADTLLVDLPDTEDQLSSKKKKKKRHYNNHDEEKQGEGDPASADQTNAEDPFYPRKKKKKNKTDPDNEQEQVDGDPASADQTNAEDHFYPRKKKKKNKTDPNNEQEQVAGGVLLVEQPNLEAPEHTKKKKKRRHDTGDEQSKGEGDQTCSGQADTEGEPQPKKKKNKKQQDEDKDQGEEDAASSAQLDVLSPLDSVKKRKKKKSVENPELHQKEDGLLEAELASTGHSKHKKKKHRESVLESSANINENESPTERPAEKHKQKKHKSLQGTLAKENISEVAEPITEEGDAQCEPRLIKKSRKRDKSVAADPDLSEPATEDKVEKSVSKKKKRKKTLEEATSEHDPVPKSPAATKPTSEGDEQDLRAQQENVQRHRIALSQEMIHNLTSSKPITKKKRNSEKCEDILATLSQNDIDLLKEFFPKLMSLKKSTITTLIHEDLERIREAKKKGITYLKGRFTTEENNQLRKNVAEFMTMTEIDSAEKLFHSQRYPDQRDWIEQKKKELNFRYRIAESIARPVHEVCHRGVKMFDESSNKGRYTEEEVEKLKKYWTMYGNKWKVLGDLVGRNNATLQLKASQLRQEVVRGSWTKKEINRMIKAIKSFVLSPNCSNNPESSQEPDVIPKRKLYQGIPWVQIEKKVKTRNWSQCKTKWTEVLLSRMNNGTNVLQGAAGLELSINFIKWLHASGIKDSGQVNWAELADHLGNIPPMVVQVHFYKLKSKYVPNWKNVAFEEIVHRLYKDGIPQLNALLLTMRTQTTLQPQVIEIKNEFSVAEIFRTYTSEEKHMIMRSKKNGP